MIRVVALLAIVAIALGGCGGDDDEGGGKPRLTVSAATSLTNAFEDYGENFDTATARFTFAGSDEGAAQIRQGVKPDLYAAANTKLPDQLFEEGLVEKPVKFAGNRLVIAVAKDRDDITSIEDLGQEDVQLAIGSEDVPVGEYTREVIGRLEPEPGEAILDNVRSEEPDVAGVVGKLTQGAADAGFLYITDVTAAGEDVKAVELPADLQPSVEYGAAVVVGAKEPAAAKAFIDGLLNGRGLAAMRRAGFEPPPE